MKKLLIIFSVMLGAFSMPVTSSAATIYQQLTDSSASQTAATIVGSFTSASSNLIQPGLFRIILTNPDSSSHNPVANIRIRRHDSPATDYAGFDCGGTSIAAGASLVCDWQNPGPSGNAYIVGLNGNTNWQAGVQYDIWQTANMSFAGVVVSSGFVATDRNLYGYMTDAQGASIPTDPNIPGYTDFGIATSTQRQFCASNFATSSGFWSDISAGFANAMCNVGVMLFIPSSNAVSQFQTLASSSQQKIPFSYYTDVVGIIGAQSGSSSENFPTYGIDLGAVDFGSSSGLAILPAHLDFLSTSTINRFLPPGMHTLLYNLMVFAIWLDVMWLLYHRIVPHKPKI